MTTALPPLRLTRDRLWFLAVLAALYASLPYILVPSRILEVATLNDFANYWSAGATVGTSVLTDRSKLYAWQTAHGLAQQPFVYPPGFAWAYAPFAHIAPPVFALFAEQVVMIGIFAAAALLIARFYGLGKLFAAGIVFAWGPTVCTIEAGQNTGIAVVLTLGVIGRTGMGEAGAHRSGSGIAALQANRCGNPRATIVDAPRNGAQLVIAALCGVGWYFLSVYGAAGDWHWPVTYVDTVHAWYARNSGGNAHLVYTLPTMLLANGASTAVAFVASAALMLAAAPLFRASLRFRGEQHGAARRARRQRPRMVLLGGNCRCPRSPTRWSGSPNRYGRG